jgi:uncharacterized protein
MNENEVRKLASSVLFEGRLLRGTVVETHISWVILTRKFAFKIKKPLKLPFLDFSTLAPRKYFCEREVLLNNRFSDIYIGTMPIRCPAGQWRIGDAESEIMDYCVIMKRMNVSKRMDNRLRSRKVDEKLLRALAVEIASFHNQSHKIFSPFNLSKARQTFNEILSSGKFVSEAISGDFSDLIVRSASWSDEFLEVHQSRLQQRIDQGLKRDVHGDLHSGNIFLYKHPILFDCIEFNDDYRKIDVLYEIAFLCMDLEAFHQKRLAAKFLSEYKKHFACFQVDEDDDIFIYFKCLRANIRAKVHIISATQADTRHELKFHCINTKKYLTLMKDYMSCLQSTFLERANTKL